MLRKTDSGNPNDWIVYATIDLDAVRLLAEQKVSFPVCKSKLAEALEKGMKADLLSRGRSLDRIHDLQKLNDHLASYDQAAAEELQSAVDDLADSYITGRYPGFDLEDPDWLDVGRLLATVSQYVEKLVC